MDQQTLKYAEYYSWLNEQAEKAFDSMEGADGGEFETLSGKYSAYTEAAKEFVKRFKNEK